MTEVAGATLFDWAKDVGIPVATFLLGFAVSRWTLTKKDRKDLEQKNYENSNALIAQHDAAYDAYTKAIATYVVAPAATVENFVAIATLGDRYLVQLNHLCSAILSQKVDIQLRDEVLLPKVRDAVARTLPQHYATLQAIAEKQGFPYSGELRRSDYGAVLPLRKSSAPAPNGRPSILDSARIH